MLEVLKRYFIFCSPLSTKTRFIFYVLTLGILLVVDERDSESKVRYVRHLRRIESVMVQARSKYLFSRVSSMRVTHYSHGSYIFTKKVTDARA